MWLVAALCLASVACGWLDPSGRPSRAGPDGGALLPVSLPDLSRMDPPVQEQIRAQFGSLTQKIEDAATPSDELSTTYGSLGMLLMAAEYYEAAEPCFLNAQALVPADVRWPYHLAHLHKNTGETERSMAGFERTLALRPDDLPALVWLGRMHLDRGEPEAAETLFARARARAAPSVAVLAGLGQAALARERYAEAVQYLEEALTIDPESSSVHSPLALAYRGLGDMEQAEAHLKLWKNTDILFPDPLRQELDLLLQSGLSYELRGVRSFESGDWPGAAAFFRQGLELTRRDAPLSRSLRHKLGTALFLSGDVRGAREQFEEVTRLAPPAGLDESTAKAYYSLGVLMASVGREREAIEQLSAAVKYQPTYVEAQLALGDILRRNGRVEASIAVYREALTFNPRLVDAEFGLTIGLVRLARYREARDRLDRAVVSYPDDPRFQLALARVLASAPDDRVRDGARALALVEQLIQAGRSLELGETLAMALAELGDYVSAATTQRDVIASAEQVGQTGFARGMAANLRLYEAGRPCRAPWREDDPVHTPGPPVNAALRAELEGAPAGR
jgi:tetratricopeptide (TPR) repeat protein